MLTEKQKSILREMIELRPYAAYMTQLAASDEFALAEIAAFSESKRAELDAKQEELDAARELYEE